MEVYVILKGKFNLTHDINLIGKGKEKGLS